jgi:hypothetical protein
VWGHPWGGKPVYPVVLVHCTDPHYTKWILKYDDHMHTYQIVNEELKTCLGKIDPPLDYQAILNKCTEPATTWILNPESHTICLVGPHVGPSPGPCLSVEGHDLPGTDFYAGGLGGGKYPKWKW